MKPVILYVEDERPEVAAAILRERARLMYEGRVYVKAYTRSWPGGMPAARKAIRKHKPGYFHGLRLDRLRLVKSA